MSGQDDELLGAFLAAAGLLYEREVRLARETDPEGFAEVAAAARAGAVPRIEYTWGDPQITVRAVLVDAAGGGEVIELFSARCQRPPRGLLN